MKKIFAFVAIALLGTLSAADAQLSFITPDAEQARAPRAARERGPALDLAVEAAQLAVASCEAKGFKVTAVVVDSAAVPIVILSGDGAAVITQAIGMGKATSSVKIGMNSGDIAKQATTDSALAARLAADPTMGVQRAGGVVIKAGSDIIGAIAVSGTPSGQTDEGCAQAGLDKVAARLK